jgi:serine/threonine protein kinase
MGVVFKARQKGLERLVAVKMILAGPLAGKEFVQRFRSEAAAAAILQHPNIVAIHEVGVHEGRHYFSLDYVEGKDLAQMVGQRALPPRRAARYVERIARAIHYAHERGILHRDLKPSNVLIDRNDQPRITDFGLAKRLEDSASLTVTGQVLGSPNFMPPEQAGAKHGKTGRPSDVYALGGILYYLLTARAPFHAESLEHVIGQVLHAEPIPPRLLNPAVPKDLETITLKCLAKESDRRYPSAEELADELDRFHTSWGRPDCSASSGNGAVPSRRAWPLGTCSMWPR